MAHDRRSAGDVLAGEDEQGAQQHGGLAGVQAETGEDPPVLEVAEAVLDRGAGGGQGLVGVPLGGGGLAGGGGFPAGDDDRVAGVGVQAGEPEVGQGAEPGGAQVPGEVVVAGGGDLAGGAAAGAGDPDQVACLVGEGEEQQPVFLVLAVEILAVGRAGAAAGRDQGAVQQHRLSALLPYRGEGAVQAGRPGGEELDDLPGPPVDGGGRDAVAAGHVSQAVVVAQRGQHDQRDLPRRQLAPPGADLLQVSAEQAGDEGERLPRQR